MRSRALIVAGLLIALWGCGSQPLREIFQPSKGAAALGAGLRQYDDGAYAEAARNLQGAIDLGLSNRERANAHKHLARSRLGIGHILDLEPPAGGVEHGRAHPITLTRF